MLSYRNSTAQLAASSIDTAVISAGSTEQCGPCLPFHLDTLPAAYFAHAWGEAVNGYVLPTMPFNTSEEHSAFIGTVTLRPATVSVPEFLPTPIQQPRIPILGRRVLAQPHAYVPCCAPGWHFSAL